MVIAVIFLIVSGNIAKEFPILGWVVYFLALIFIVLSFIFFEAKIHKESYRQGQIDALTGKIHYKIEIDSTKNWVEIKK